MNIPFRPILSALLRNRVGAVLVAGQIAIALAVLVNAVYIVKQRVDMMGRPTGIDVENVFIVSATGFGRNLNHVAMVEEDLGYLQSLPGVIGATTSNSVPLSGSGSSDYVKRRPDEMIGRQSLVNYFEVTDRGADTLGVKLSAGRWFTRERSRAAAEDSVRPLHRPDCRQSCLCGTDVPQRIRAGQDAV